MSRKSRGRSYPASRAVCRVSGWQSIDDDYRSASDNNKQSNQPNMPPSDALRGRTGRTGKGANRDSVRRLGSLRNAGWGDACGPGGDSAALLSGSDAEAASFDAVALSMPTAYRLRSGRSSAASGSRRRSGRNRCCVWPNRAGGTASVRDRYVSFRAHRLGRNQRRDKLFPLRDIDRLGTCLTHVGARPPPRRGRLEERRCGLSEWPPSSAPRDINGASPGGERGSAAQHRVGDHRQAILVRARINAADRSPPPVLGPCSPRTHYGACTVRGRWVEGFRAIPK